MKYLMVLPVEFYRVDDNTIACESAFAKHLKELLPRVSDWGDEIVIHSPLMDKDRYLQNKAYLAHINCTEEKIFYIEAFPSSLSRLQFTLRAPFSIWPRLWRIVKTANVVHSGPSKDIFKAFAFVSLFFAVIQGKKNLFVMDIDHRNSGKMLYRVGKLSLKSYLLMQYVYNPLISLQLRFVTKYCNLAIFKGKSIVEDYGKGRPQVKSFYNTVHDRSIVLTEEELNTRLAALTPAKKNIKLVYFGRLVEYKGIQDMIKATKLVATKLKQSGSDLHVSLSIIGAGEIKPELQALVKSEQLEDSVIFYEALNYGKELFDELKTHDFLLAAPKSEDTPRSVFDAMACGLPIIAYDTHYYRDLEHTGTIKTVPWLSIEGMADKIIELASDHETVKKMTIDARDFALNNTQDIWLNRRLAWCKEFL